MRRKTIAAQEGADGLEHRELLLRDARQRRRRRVAQERELDHQWVVGVALIAVGAPTAYAGVKLFAHVSVIVATIFVFCVTWIILEECELESTAFMLLIALPVTILYAILAVIWVRRKARSIVGGFAGMAGAALGYCVGAIIGKKGVNAKDTFDPTSANYHDAAFETALLAQLEDARLIFLEREGGARR